LSFVFVAHLALSLQAAPLRFQEGVPDVQGWRLEARAEMDATVDVIMALKNRNVARLHSEIIAVSTPSSARYGEHLSSGALAALTSPAPEAVRSIRTWRHESGIEHTVSPGGDKEHATKQCSVRLVAYRGERVAPSSAGIGLLRQGNLYRPGGTGYGWRRSR
jgi:hypothetical protein